MERLLCAGSRVEKVQEAAEQSARRLLHGGPRFEDEGPQSASPSGPWKPLKSRIFPDLLLANLASEIRTFMQTVGGAWLMVSFALALPAGELGDIVNLWRIILVTEYWMLGAGSRSSPSWT